MYSKILKYNIYTICLCTVRLHQEFYRGSASCIVFRYAPIYNSITYYNTNINIIKLYKTIHSFFFFFFYVKSQGGASAPLYPLRGCHFNIYNSINGTVCVANDRTDISAGDGIGIFITLRHRRRR